DPEVLRAKAVEKGMMDRDAAERLSESECFNLILAAGFSTKTEVSDVSGRGVGMDVVRTRIAQLNGTIGIESTKGVGTQIAIKVRSEEHTSELQSRENLVCRLLLEKKKKTTTQD